MATELTMPKMGFDMEEGKLAQWLKNVGDEVKRGDSVAEIETDKVNIEVEAPDPGILLATFIEAGQTVPVGTLIGVLGAAGEEIDIDALRKKAASAAATETVAASAPATPAPAAAPAVATVAAAPARANGRVKASPLARRIAKDAGLDIGLITGTGPGGRIVRRDVDAAIATGVGRPALTLAPVVLGPATLSDEEIPTSKLRQTIARRMTASRQEVPHFYVTSEIDMAEAMALRRKLNEMFGGEFKIRVDDMVLKAAAVALTHFPNINASYNQTTLRRHGAVHIGIAVALEQGLITVVVHDADRKPLAQIARESNDVITRAKSGKSHVEDFQGSTFTISNLGMFDVESFVAIINPPEAAILAVGSVLKVPVVEDGELTVGMRMKVTISADHRVTDGAEAARYLQMFKQNLEEPLRLLV